MKLKKRLISSNAAIVMIPLLITIAVSFIYMFAASKILNKDVKFSAVENVMIINYELQRAGEIIQGGNPERLINKEFQKHLVESFSNIKAEIVIKKRHDIIFSSGNRSNIDIEKCLEASKERILNNIIEIDGQKFLLKNIQITFNDKDKGQVLLIAPLAKEWPVFLYFLIIISIVFGVCYLIANVVFSLGISRSIITPVSRLKKGASEISCGNLDYEIIEEGDEEIRELCHSFEMMRIKLKESVYTQMKYDENRKMLVSSISHDLKTPITAIKGYVEGIMDKVADTPEKVDKYLKVIYSKAFEVDAMIEDLLLYSKLDLKQVPYNFEKVDPAEYLRDCFDEYIILLKVSNIKIQFVDKLVNPTIVMMDRDKFRRSVTNIIDNAIKYCDKINGNIILALRETAENVIIDIEDNGEGIPKNDLPYIFDRFYRVDASRGKVSGSGLGLAISKQIIEDHGGKIWVKSVENEGTKVMISLKKV